MGQQKYLISKTKTHELETRKIKQGIKGSIKQQIKHFLRGGKKRT